MVFLMRQANSKIRYDQKKTFRTFTRRWTGVDFL